MKTKNKIIIKWPRKSSMPLIFVILSNIRAKQNRICCRPRLSNHKNRAFAEKYPQDERWTKKSKARHHSHSEFKCSRLSQASAYPFHDS